MIQNWGRFALWFGLLVVVNLAFWAAFGAWGNVLFAPVCGAVAGYSAARWQAEHVDGVRRDV